MNIDKGCLCVRAPLFFVDDVMRAMIFAAGLGTRLKPLTDSMPKALVPVSGRPLLEYTLHKLIQSGCNEIVVNVYHFAPLIIDYLHTCPFMGCAVKISDERPLLLDTGGGLRAGLSLFDSSSEPILVHNVDILSNVDLAKFYERNRHNSVTLLVSERKTSRYLLFNENNELMGWTNMNTGEVKTPYADLDVNACRKYAFSGIHLISPSMGTLMNDFPNVFSIVDFYVAICDKVKICADVGMDLQLLDVGKLDALDAAESFVREYYDE